MYQPDKALFRPAQHAEHQLITAILNGTWSPGTSLPAERLLSEQLGITRQTLRELLQRLAGDGWLTIQHGKPTIVNDFWARGGLGILKTLVNFTDYLPPPFVAHLLQVRTALMPACAAASVPRHPDLFLTYLQAAETLGASPEAFAVFDWGLQCLMARLSDNMIYPLILNDFTPVYSVLGGKYFTLEKGRTASAGYYQKLSRAIRKNVAVDGIVRQAMAESQEIWEESQQAMREGKTS
jgi:GntR family negative regulator for fad regulon and positive regulator of fabA